MKIPARTICAFGLAVFLTIIAASLTANAQTYSWGHPDADAPIPFRNGDLMGYMDKSKKIVIPAKFDVALRFYEGLAVVHIGRKVGFIDRSGKFVIDAKYNGASNFLEGMAPVNSGRKWGFVNRSGKLAIPMIYDSVSHFNEGRAGVQKGRKRGFIDRTGKVIVPIKYSSVGFFSSGLAMVEVTRELKVTGKEPVQKIEKGYVDRRGKIVIPTKYYYATEFHSGLAHVRYDDPKKGMLDGYIDPTGAVVIALDAKNYECSDFSEGLAWANGRFIDTSGLVAIDPKGEYKFVDVFHDGLAPVEKDGKIGYINKSGEIVIYPIYEDGRADSGLGTFNGGLAPVKLGSKFGYINKKGKMVIEPKYDKVLPFESGLGWVQLGGEENVFYIGPDGTEYREP